MIQFRAKTPLFVILGLLGACGTSTSPPAPVASPAPVAAASPAPVTSAAKPPPAAPGMARLAPRDPTLDAWKREAAQKIHAANRAQLFEGRPHHLLQAVIVVAATVDRNGQVMASRVTRSPGIKSLDQMALASLKSASPLPAPPVALLVRGNLVYSDTWLGHTAGRFQVRTLALPQEEQKRITSGPFGPQNAPGNPRFST